MTSKKSRTLGTHTTLDSRVTIVFLDLLMCYTTCLKDQGVVDCLQTVLNDKITEMEQQHEVSDDENEYQEYFH